VAAIKRGNLFSARAEEKMTSSYQGDDERRENAKKSQKSLIQAYVDSGACCRKKKMGREVISHLRGGERNRREGKTSNGKGGRAFNLGEVRSMSVSRQRLGGYVSSTRQGGAGQSTTKEGLRWGKEGAWGGEFICLDYLSQSLHLEMACADSLLEGKERLESINSTAQDLLDATESVSLSGESVHRGGSREKNEAF